MLLLVNAVHKEVSMVLDATGFISAIKTVRTLGGQRYEITNNGQGFAVTPLGTIGLKEAKDFVEDIMALGVERYLAEQATAQRNVVIARQERTRRAQPPVAARPLSDWADRDDIDF
jgi:hypothetical protein